MQFHHKVISKILAQRLRPFIPDLVSNAQAAFVPGREIANNIILLREVLHYFKQRSYNRKEFCLKVYLSKAFDRMDWGYMDDILTALGFPLQFKGWILACVKSAEFSVLVNGWGDGFLKPQCGLRQGCALSHICSFWGWICSPDV